MIGFPGIGRRHGVRDLLSAYMDGQVSDSEARRVEQHLDGCDECRLDLESLTETVALLRDLSELEVPRSFALSEAPAEAVRMPRLISGVRLAAPVAAVALVLLVVGDALGIVSQTEVSEPQPVLSVAAGSGAVPEIMAARSVAREADPAVEVAKEVVKEVAVEVQKVVEVEKETVVEAVAVEAAPVEGAVEEPGPRSASPGETPQDLPTVAAESAAAEAPPVVVAQQPPAPAELAVDAPVEVETLDAETPETALDEPEGFTLPLWQLEVAVGGLLAVLILAAFWGWRRADRGSA